MWPTVSSTYGPAVNSVVWAPRGARTHSVAPILSPLVYELNLAALTFEPRNINGHVHIVYTSRTEKDDRQIHHELVKCKKKLCVDLASCRKLGS